MATKISVNDIVLAESNIGYVRYIGPMYDASKNCTTSEAFVGIELLEPTGDNDGSIDGTRYFVTEGGQNYGLMVPLNRIQKKFTGWDLLKQFRVQHHLLYDIAKHWNESISALEKCQKRIEKLENQLRSQKTFLKQQSTSSISSVPINQSQENIYNNYNQQTSIEKVDSLYDVRPIGFQPRGGKYSIERYSQASQFTDVPSIPTQESFRSDISGVSSLSGWEFLEQWRAKASADGRLPALNRDDSNQLPTISEHERTPGALSEQSSYYISPPLHLRLNNELSLDSQFSNPNLHRDDSIQTNSTTTAPEYSIIWGVLSPTSTEI